MNGISDNDAILPQQHSDGSVVTVWDEVAAILSALIGGGRYGLKIRVPHAVGKFNVPPYVHTMLNAYHISLYFNIHDCLPHSFSQIQLAYYSNK